MTLIKNEALLHGKCIALVIHQPRNEIFYLLDDLLLLKVIISSSYYHFEPIKYIYFFRRDVLYIMEMLLGLEKTLYHTCR